MDFHVCFASVDTPEKGFHAGKYSMRNISPPDSGSCMQHPGVALLEKAMDENDAIRHV